MMYLISACLAGINCRYDGKNSEILFLSKLVKEGKAMAICPEILGELCIPRERCEIVIDKHDKKIISVSGQDYTAAFTLGAQKTLKLAQLLEIKSAILKSKSPSCGYGYIYDGTFSGKLVAGKGITAKLLDENGIKIYNEENFNSLFKKNIKE